MSCSSVHNHHKKTCKHKILFLHVFSFLKSIQYHNNCTCLIPRNINHSFLHCIVRGKLILHINTTNSDYHNMRNQYQHQNPGFITGILALSFEAYKCCRTYHQIEHGNAITADIYCQQLHRLNEVLHRNCRALANRKDFILNHDNGKHTHEKPKKKNS